MCLEWKQVAVGEGDVPDEAAVADEAEEEATVQAGSNTTVLT
jgi:hypothetical protein